MRPGPRARPAARRNDAADDDFLWDQGPASGLSRIQFHDPAPVFAARSEPNVALFREQIAALKAARAINEEPS